MRALLIHAVVMTLAWHGCHYLAHAQTPELPPLAELQSRCAPQVEHRRALLEHEGDPGIWLAEPVAACMVGRLRLLPELHRLLTLEGERTRVLGAQLELRERQLSIGADIEASLEEALDRAHERQVQASRWWRHPALWWAVGVASSVALQVAAIRTLGAI